MFGERYNGPMTALQLGVGGALLTGGASRRMGFDKASVQVDGVPNAVRLAAVLGEVASPVVEVGPGRSGLVAVDEQPPGQGPLSATCAAWETLRAMGHFGPVLVVACDLPFVTAEDLGLLATWPGPASVVPVAAGRPQPLCARWSPEDLSAARLLVQGGERSMKALLLRPGVVFVDEKHWPEGKARRVFADFDTPSDLADLGLGGPGT
jgi:molybdopterin-guanine dinucleotide biosynthesis protein A